MNRQNEDHLITLAPENSSLTDFYSSPLFKPFDQKLLGFLSCMSEELLKNSYYKQDPELIALGFWLRPGNLKRYQSLVQGLVKPLGTVIHFTPTNVDTMFVYSWVCSLLMGNRNLVRVSSRSSQAQSKLLSLLNKFFVKDEYRDIGRANLFVNYPKQSHWSETISAYADARVIWGGDESVQSIRQHLAKPRCRDISFADRYSATLINGDGLQSEVGVSLLAEKLWKDTKPYEQQACSSPTVIYWLGNTQRQGQLYRAINELAKTQSNAIGQTNNHLVTSQFLTASGVAYSPDILEYVCFQPVAAVSELHLNNHLGSGLFYVVSLDSIALLGSLLDEKLQTLSYWGISKTDLLKLLEDPSIIGIDRLVPLGQALDFDVFWDGFDLFSQLSRQVSVE